MCGILGILAGSPLDASLPRAMLSSLEHRGPDEGGLIALPDAALHPPNATPTEGPETRAPVWLGNRRLRVQDATTAGRQPMDDGTGRVWVVHNGEIYNAPALRAELEEAGHRFHSRTDTEVIAHLYQEHGLACVERLEGMFATAIWDAGTRDLHLIRDRLGIKPLYLATPTGTPPQEVPILAFASEVRTLLQVPGVRGALDPDGLASYLTFGSVQEPHTLVEGIRSLPPAQTLTVHVPEAGPPQVGTPARYWTLPMPDPAAQAAPVEAVRDRLRDAVRDRLLSDVPLGAFLSGGLDSGAVAALMVEAARAEGRDPHMVRTFTLAFDAPEADEGAQAAETSAHLGTSHTERRATPEDALRDLPAAVAAMDQPSTDGVNTWLVSREARRGGLTVALSGLGSDELFLGYPAFRRHRAVQRLLDLGEHLPAPVGAALGRQARALVKSDRGDKLAAALDGSLAPFGPALAERVLFTPARTQRLAPALDAPSRVLTWWRALADGEPALTLPPDGRDRASRTELRTYLLSVLLRDSDQMSMAHALEVRVPFLDHRLVEEVLQCPAALKLQPGRKKPLLSDAMADLLPSAVLDRPKATFDLPWDTWLRGPLRKTLEERLANVPEPLAHHLDAEEVHAVWQDFLDGRTSWSRPWSLHVLFEWVDRHLGDAGPGQERADVLTGPTLGGG